MKNTDEQFHIGIVEDDAAVSKIAAHYLKSRFGEKVRVEEISQVDVAIGRCAAGLMDICITDLDMPAMNGFGLLRRLKEIDPLVQVVIMTAHPLQNAIVSAFSLGADEFLHKPIRRNELCNSVAYLRKRLLRYRSEMSVAD